MYIYFLTVCVVRMLLHPSRLLEPGLFVCVQASTNTKMINIWRFFVLVVGAPLLPLTAAEDGPDNKVGVSRGYGIVHYADRGEGGTGTGIGASTGPPCYMAAVQRIFSFTTHDGGV